MVKIVKNPGNGRLNILNNPVLNVLKYRAVCKYLNADFNCFFTFGSNKDAVESLSIYIRE